MATFMAVLDDDKDKVVGLLLGHEYGLYYRHENDWVPLDEDDNPEVADRHLNRPIQVCSEDFIPRYDTAERLGKLLDDDDII